jgi:phosphoethanolamine N-methyltransferase
VHGPSSRAKPLPPPTPPPRSEGEPSPAFAAYIKQRGYDLHSIPGYGRLLEAAGFVDVKAEDRTRQVGRRRGPAAAGVSAAADTQARAQSATRPLNVLLHRRRPRPRPRPRPLPQFIDCLSAELARVEENRESFTSRFGADGYAAVVDGWRDKLARARAGEQRWGLFVARKPQQ